MTGLKIEGDIEGIHEAQLDFLKESIEKLGFRDAKVVVETLGKAGDNYTAAVKRVQIEDNQNNGRTLKIVAKFAPTNQTFRDMGKMELIFKNEHIVYTKLIPKLEQLQHAAGIPAEDRLKYASLYGSNPVAPYEVILLEDLNEIGYTMLDRFTSLTNECVRSVFKSLAILHALSYAMKQKDPETFEELRKELFDMWADIAATNGDGRKFFEQIESNVIPLLESDVHKKAVKGIMTETLNANLRFAKINKDSKHAVIQQGDSWTNNIMFKLDNPSKAESIMIDYQLSKVANPVADLHYMVFNCTDYETRKAHYLDWIDYYHHELDNSLSYFGLKVNFVYPRDQLDADLKRHGKWSLGQAMIVSSMLIRKNEEAAVMKEAMQSANVDEMLKQGRTDNLGADTIALFKRKLEGLINSHLELGFL